LNSDLAARLPALGCLRHLPSLIINVLESVGVDSTCISNGPLQSNPDVFLRTEAAHITYVRVFGGFESDTTIQTEVRRQGCFSLCEQRVCFLNQQRIRNPDHSLCQASQLATALLRDNIAFNTSTYSYAGYDAPSRIVSAPLSHSLTHCDVASFLLRSLLVSVVAFTIT
jgi:hypothetical protein